MKAILTVIAASLIVLAASPQLFAAGGCPKTAENLQAFASCLAPVPGTIAMVYKGTMANLDRDHVQLLNAMQANPGVPPQVIPSYPVYQPFYSNPFGPMMWSAMAYVSAVKSGNPYSWWMMGGVPLW